MLTRIRNCQILKPIEGILPKLHPNEVFAEVVFYDTKLYIVTDINFRPIHEDNRSLPNDADLRSKFRIFNMGGNFI